MTRFKIGDIVNLKGNPKDFGGISQCRLVKTASDYIGDGWGGWWYVDNDYIISEDIMTLKESDKIISEVREDIHPIPTKQLQMKSLIAFMECLGYTLFNCSAYGPKFFMSDKPSNKGRGLLKFETCVKLHNGVYLDWHQTQYGSPRMQDGLNFDNYSLTRAFACRIVDTVKLQYTGKTKSIICQSDWVSFVDPSYKSLFLGKGGV